MTPTLPARLFRDNFVSLYKTYAAFSRCINYLLYILHMFVFYNFTVPTPVLSSGSIMSSTISTMTSSHPYVAPETNKLPQDKFIVRTILHSNMTILHNRVEDFKAQLEQKLTRAYRRAYDEDKFPR